jgi:hypothetical protein
MKAKISSLGVTDKRLIILGVVFLVIGLLSSIYYWTQLVGELAFGISALQIFYPTGNIGIIVVVAGIILIVLGFLIPSLETQQQRILSLGTRSLGLIVFGIVFLTIGLVTSDYLVLLQLVGPDPFAVFYQAVYPYRDIGVILLALGILIVAQGFLLSEYSEAKSLDI